MIWLGEPFWAKNNVSLVSIYKHDMLFFVILENDNVVLKNNNVVVVLFYVILCCLVCLCIAILLNKKSHVIEVLSLCHFRFSDSPSHS